MLADVSRTTRMLIVIVVIILIVCETVLISHKSHVIRNVLFLYEIFDIES